MFTFDPYSPQVDADPFPYYKILRDEHPCFWSPEARMWVLSRHADIKHALQDWQTYSSASGNLMDELPDRAGATLGTTDPPRHDRLRALISHAFTKRNLEALAVVFRLKRVYAYDSHPERAAQYATDARAQFGIEAVPVADPKQAVVSSDIVVTAGPILRTPHATIHRGWLREGTFASLVDFDSYWHPAALHEVDKFCTDDIPQLHYYRDLSYFQDIPLIHADLGELVTGKRPGRQNAQERTIGCNLGIALDDMATAPLVHGRALQKGIGSWLNL